MAKKNNKKQRGKRRAAHKNPSLAKAARANKTNNKSDSDNSQAHPSSEAPEAAERLAADASSPQSPDNQELPSEPAADIAIDSSAQIQRGTETSSDQPAPSRFNAADADRVNGADTEPEIENGMTNEAEDEVDDGASTTDSGEDSAPDDKAEIDMSADSPASDDSDANKMADNGETELEPETQTEPNSEMPQDAAASDDLDTASIADNGETEAEIEPETQTEPKSDISQDETETETDNSDKTPKSELLIEARNIGKRFALQQAQSQEQYKEQANQPLAPESAQQTTELSLSKRGTMIKAIKTMPESITKVFRRSTKQTKSTSFLSSSSAAPAISAQSDSLEILRGLDLKVAHGDTVAIVGVSGSGKSTLLSLLAGLDIPDEGSIHIDGEDISLLSETERSILRAKKMAFVFQDFMLLPHLTALENVLLPLEMKAKANARDRATEELEKVGLGDRKNHFPSQLSGGEQQRTALARAFASEPLLLFADEPSGNLDGATGQQISDLLFDLNRSSATTLVVVTHDMKLAARCSKIYELNQGSLSVKSLDEEMPLF